MSRIRAIIVLCILTEFSLILSLSFRPKNIKLEKYENCPDSENLSVRYRDLNISMPKINLYTISALIEVDHNITVETAISLSVKRCTLDRTHCEDYDHLTISKLCNKLRQAKSMWAPMINMIQPPPACPLVSRTYRMTNATADLAIVSRLPLDGYRWVVRITYHPDGNPKKVLMCVDVEVSIRTQKRRHN